MGLRVVQGPNKRGTGASDPEHDHEKGNTAQGGPGRTGSSEQNFGPVHMEDVVTAYERLPPREVLDRHVLR